MTRSTRWFGVLLGSALAAVFAGSGCNGSHPTADADVAALVTAQCQEALRCCTVPSDLMQYSNGMWNNLAGCQEYMGLSEEGSRYELDRALAEGLVTLSSTGVQACIAALAAQPCADFGTTLPACNAALLYTGNVGDGGDCYSSIDCVASDFCSMSLGLSNGGVCVPLQKIGDVCNQDSDCAAPGYCYAKTFKCAKLGDDRPQRSRARGRSLRGRCRRLS